MKQGERSADNVPSLNAIFLILYYQRVHRTNRVCQIAPFRILTNASMVLLSWTCNSCLPTVTLCMRPKVLLAQHRTAQMNEPSQRPHADSKSAH